MNEEKLAVATHMYVRLRRLGGRAIDVIWAVRNREYAEEIVKLARALPDEELARLTDRFEYLVLGIVRVRKAPAAATIADDSQDWEPQVANRYVGALR